MNLQLVKKNIYLSSELKSREYLCRGLPIISSTKIDIIPNNFKYIFKVPEDNSNIDINSVIKFVQNIYVNDKIKQNSTVQLVSSEIRQFAEKNCSMEIAMDQSLSTYSGGLGFLAGSHMLSAGYLQMPMVGVTMLWSYGYYDQRIVQDGQDEVAYIRK